MKNVLGKIKLYLTDWKNIMTHSLVGIGIVILGFFSPIHPHARITLVASVICLNTIRMKLF